MTSVYIYIKLSVIVIPRISPSTAAAQCQQDSTIHKTSLFIQRSNSIIIHLAQKIPSIPPPIPPTTVFFLLLSLPQFSYILYQPIYFCVPVPYLTQATSPHLTSLSPLPHQPLRKKPLLPMRRRSLSFHETPFFHFGSIVHVDGIGRSGVPVFEVDDGSSLKKREKKKEMLGWV